MKKDQGYWADIANRIVKLRTEADWSQAELARKAKVTASAINMIERGQRNPSLIVLRKISDALKVSLAEITGEQAQDNLTMDSQTFFRKYGALKDLDQSDQELILAMIDTLRGKKSEKG